MSGAMPGSGPNETKRASERPAEPARRARRRLLRRWRRSTAGGVTVELAFVIPILLALAVGGFDFGRLALQKMAVTGAARAGAQYGSLDFATAVNIAGIIQAARNDAGDVLGILNVTARQYCVCPGQGEVVCTAPCDDGQFSLMYVDVTVQDQLEFLLGYPGVASPVTIASNARMRVR